MSLGAKIALSAFIEQSVASDLSNTKDTINYAKNIVLTNGAGADQANKAFSDTRTIAAGATDSIDLAGALTDVFGNTITFTEIKGIIIAPASANGSTLTLGGAASNGFDSWVSAAGDSIVLRAGGLFALMAPDADGYAVTAGTGDLLDITNDDGAAVANYDIIIIGTAS